MPRFEMIGFDADDTLWHNEKHYVESQARFSDLLGRYGTPESILGALHRTEMQNLELYGYGMKGFALSMIETAVQLSNGNVSGAEIMKIIAIARDLLHAPLQLLDHAERIIPLLASSFPLMLVTKGDLRDQETKVTRSGLGKYFRHVEILSDKGPENYRALLERHGIGAERFLMVGNSLRSDIWPVLALGASAVYVPHHFLWAHEAAEEPPLTHPGYHSIGHLGELPDLLERLNGRVDSRAR
jgi:putative hydrolase of the HAD superfamily